MESNLDSASNIAKFLEGQWFEKTGLIAVLLIVTGIEASFFVVTHPPWWGLLIILFASWIFTFIVWFFSRLPPKTPKGKIGFIVSIASVDDKESERLREDFIIPLRRLVNSGKSGKAFHFKELPYRFAKNIIDVDDAQELRVKTRSHFILFGRLRFRNNIHYMELNGIVAHNPIPDSIQQKFAKELSELLPRKVQISGEADLLAFEFTSEWADIVAKYIIGIAVSISGDLNYAEILFSDALERLQTKNKDFPVFQKLSKRIPLRISEIYEARARAAYRLWTETKNPVYIEELEKFLEKISNEHSQLPGTLNLKAISVFLKNRDIKGAIGLLKKIEEVSSLWHCNMAFLHGYDGDLKNSIRHYRHAANLPIEPEAVGQVEDFICWIIEKEPEKFWLFYCLGFFNWKIKADSLQATSDLRSFVMECKDKNFAKEQTLAERWLVELEGVKL